MRSQSETIHQSPRQSGRPLARIFSIGIAAALTSIGAVEAAAAEKIILVLDSSGSMAGKISGKRKIDIARGAVSDLLSTLQPGTELGLIAYGHRRKDDCSDIQTLSAVTKPDSRRIMSAVNRLRPIGKTPLGQSVLMAAKKLNYTEDKATVILVSDGKENCGVDPCALGKMLGSQGVNFKTHVIGFNLRRGEDAGLRCLARNTGGMYVEAKDAPALKKALKVTVEQARAAPPEPPKPQPESAIGGLKVRAFVKQGGPEWAGQLGITLFGPPQGLDGKRKKIANAWRKKSGYVMKGIKPGKYLMQVVLADHRHISDSREIEVPKDGSLREDIVLNVGQVRFDYALSQGGKPFSWQAGWTVYESKADFQGKRKKLVNFWRTKSGTVFWLPAGKWLIAGEIADARYMKVAKTIEVAPGGADRFAFNFNGGLVRFDAKLSEESGPYKGGLGWKILGEPKGLDAKRPQIANFWRKKSGSIFVLPAGEWNLFGELADHRQVSLSTKIVVPAGGEELHVFNFNAGTVRFDVTVEGQAVNNQLGLNVLAGQADLSGKRKKIASFWRKRSGHITILPRGDYVLDGLLADTRNVRGAVAFSVAPGDEKPVQLDLKKQ
ncbi:MAG: vWA domain-containing protein [Hyphomicrobiaceae bacterium]